jgi:hypothetical protein
MLNTRIIPGRVKIGDGVYVPWIGDRKVVDPEYLVLQQGCSCSFMPIADAVNRPGMLQTPDQVYFYAHGRVSLPGGKIALSRVATANVSYQEWFTNAKGSADTNPSPTEVLVCETSVIPNTPPVINFQNPSCGVWSSINYTNYVTSIGFNAGSPSVNNTIAWVGRGSWSNKFMAGRYQSETSASYFGYGEEFMAYASEYLIVPQGCKCELDFWV